VTAPDTEGALKEGLVLRGDARVYHVEIDGKTRPCAPGGRLFEELDGAKSPIAVGDRVRVTPTGDPARIEEVLPRRNWLSKVASSHDPREQILFANVDRVFVVASIAQPKFSSVRTDRILVGCHWSEIPATLVLNKRDLDRHDEESLYRATYERAGVEVLGTSAVTGDGIEALRERIRGSTSVFYGASGVGKSSLLNALQPGLGREVGKVSKYWDAGKHTTTFSTMVRLADGSHVIDTPGIRVFRPYGLTKQELRHRFPEFAPFASRCRFPDCSHDHEPGCAVAEAAEAGELAPSRLLSYLDLLEELAPTPDEGETIEGEFGA
jgi:ribosome biogenesis GTPase / thiamine phosphate phosphatase